MSTNTETPTTLKKGNKEEPKIQEGQVPHSTILYLLQEATKLTPPANQEPLEYRLKNGMFPREQNRQPMQHPSFPASSTSHRYVSTGGVYNHGEPGPHLNNSYAGFLSLLPSQQGSNPWEVMSLINLQCERLLHPESVEEEERGVVSFTAVSGAEGTACGTWETESTGHSLGLSGSVEHTGRSVRPRSAKDGAAEMGAFVLSSLGDTARFASRPTDLIQTHKADQRLTTGGKNYQNVCETQFGCKAEDILCTKKSLSICKKSWEDCPLGGKGKTIRVSCHEGTEQGSSDKCDVPQSTPSLNSSASVVYQGYQKRAHNFGSETEPSQSSSVALCTSVPEANHGLKMDCNSNLILALESPKHAQLQSSPQAPSHAPNVDSEAGSPRLIRGKGASVSLVDVCGSPGNRGSAPPSDFKTTQTATEPSWRGRTPRKQRHPTRSVDLCDPDFRGVCFRMHTELNDRRDQCRLLITSKYSAEFWKSGRRARGSRMRSLINSLKTSSSQEEGDPVSLSKKKMCASCNTKTTPLWRDAEDGTPLCNACGIRYKKYRVRCFQCWYIPKKEGNSNIECFKCGNVLRLEPSHRKHTKDPSAPPAPKP